MSRLGIIAKLKIIFADTTGKSADTKATELGGDIYDEVKDSAYPVGSFYIQFPDVNSNIDATAFPEAYAPGTLYGGTWEAQWSTVPTFFSTQGDFHASELQADGRTDGLQEHQSMAHEHHWGFNNGSGIGSGINYDVSNWSGIVYIRDTSGQKTDGTHGTPPSSNGYANRPQNRLIIVWKRKS